MHRHHGPGDGLLRGLVVDHAVRAAVEIELLVVTDGVARAALRLCHGDGQFKIVSRIAGQITRRVIAVREGARIT